MSLLNKPTTLKSLKSTPTHSKIEGLSSRLNVANSQPSKPINLEGLSSRLNIPKLPTKNESTFKSTYSPTSLKRYTNPDRSISVSSSTSQRYYPTYGVVFSIDGVLQTEAGDYLQTQEGAFLQF